MDGKQRVDSGATGLESKDWVGYCGSAGAEREARVIVESKAETARESRQSY